MLVKKNGRKTLVVTVLMATLMLSTMLQLKMNLVDASDSDGVILARPELFDVELFDPPRLYENLSRFEGIPLAFHMTLTGEEAGFPRGLYVTSGPLPGSVEIPPDSGNFVPASDRLFHLANQFSATVFAEGFNSCEAMVFAQGAYGNGLLITEPRENRIQRLQLVSHLPVITTFSANAGTAPFGPAGLTYDNNLNLYMTDAAGGRILKVYPNGTTEAFADVPLPQVTPGTKAYAKAVLYDTSGLYGGFLIAASWSQGYPDLSPGDAIYSISADGIVNQLLDDDDRLGLLEFITLGPGGVFGSNLFVTALGTGYHGDGGVYTMAPDGTLSPFLTGIDPSHVVFDTGGILGGGMFVTDFNQQDTGYADGPARIWRITERTVGGVFASTDKNGSLVNNIGLAAVILCVIVGATACIRHLNKRSEEK